jgi:trehalose 6-phosphate synthase/phosphatase
LIEEKAVGLAWHYRMVDPELGQRQATELRIHLAHLFCNVPVEILVGQKVVELRPHGTNKGLVAAGLVSRLQPRATIVAFGDDATDEDLFRALPSQALTLHVGRLASRAAYRLDDVAAARRYLLRLLEPAPAKPALREEPVAALSTMLQ